MGVGRMVVFVCSDGAPITRELLQPGLEMWLGVGGFSGPRTWSEAQQLTTTMRKRNWGGPARRVNRESAPL